MTDTVESLNILKFLFAGFVAAWVYYGFTPFGKPSPFERIVQALIYTAIIGLIAQPIGFLFGDTGLGSLTATGNASILFILGLSVATGFIFAVLANNNWPHRWLLSPSWRWPWKWEWRPWKWGWAITDQAVYENNLSHAFQTNKDQYIVLTLRNNTRVYGYPTSWPDSLDEDYFILADYGWLDEKGKKPDRLNDGKFLISSKDVYTIEFLITSTE